MITVPCLLLLNDSQHNRLLVAFSDPGRGLSPNRPCYLPAYACSFAPIDPDTGEYLAPHSRALGNGLLRLPESLWGNALGLIAAELEQERRNAAAERAAEERRRKKSAAAQRLEHDQQLRSERKRPKKQRKLELF